MHFEKKWGSYYCMEGARIVYMADTMAIAFDPETGTLLKHGPEESVRKWAGDAKNRMAAAGVGFEISVLVSKEFATEDLDRCLSTTGYVASLASKLMSQDPRHLA
jgi:hypothetical protein